MTKEVQASTVVLFAKGMAIRIAKQGIIWESKEGPWWYLGQLATKVNLLERVLIKKEDGNISDIAQDIAVLSMIISDLEAMAAKKVTKKKAAAKKKAAKKKAAKKTAAKKKGL